MKKKLIIAVVIVGANWAGLHGYSAPGAIAWTARQAGKILVGSANAMQGN